MAIRQIHISKNCIEKSSSCYVTYGTDQEKTKKIVFRIPYNAKYESFGFSAECSGTDLKDVKKVKLPDGCTVNLLLGSGTMACRCSGTSCEYDPTGTQTAGEQSGDELSLPLHQKGEH